jgi:tRNA (guanine-N7-)-methyltransferase
VAKVFPYAHAPRLPEGDSLDPATLFDPAPPGAVAAPVSPLELEIGPGRGWFLVERLEHAPDVRAIGLEIRRKWATIVDDRLRRLGRAHRGRVFAEDARAALPRFPDACLSVAYVHFPDPWWKKRHQKRLVVSPELLEQLARLLVDGGELLVQTDVAERADQYEALVAEAPWFEPRGESARVPDHAYGARSPRERKAIEDGLPVYRLLYRRRPRSVAP